MRILSETLRKITSLRWLDYDDVCKLRRSSVKFSAKAWIVLMLFEAIGEIAYASR